MPLTPDDLRALLRRPDLTDAQAQDIDATLRWLADTMIDTYLLEQRNCPVNARLAPSGSL